MEHGNGESSASGKEPQPAALGLVDGLDLHAEYLSDRTGGDFFDAVRVGTRVAFLLSDIAGRRQDTDPIATVMQEAFRTKSAELLDASDANIMEGTEMLLQAVNQALIGAASGGICFAPTMVGCYDLQLGLLAYVNAGQTAVILDSDGARALPGAGLPLGLTTHLTYEASMQVFEPGAKLLVVTKGVTLSMRGKTPFGPQRVIEALRGAKAESASGLCRAVLDAAHGFEKRSWARLPFGQKPVEDMTALAMVRRVPSGS
ncbi:MAG: SpoIIE family protein phosphatase [Mycobacterium sp.]|nr:SpoIIE family protein phosphatase [Mycobacterium sp.]